MTVVPNGVDTLPKIAIAWVGRINITDRRQTTDDRQTDRQTDGRTDDDDLYCIANVNSRSCSLKIGQKGCCIRHVTCFSNFGTRPISPERLKLQTSNFACGLSVKHTKPKHGMAEATNFKLSMQIEGEGYYTREWKFGQKKTWPRSRDLLFEFWDPLISLEWPKPQTSNFAWG